MPSKQYPQYNSKHVFDLLRKLEKEVRFNLVEAQQRIGACQNGCLDFFTTGDFHIDTVDARVVERAVYRALTIINEVLCPLTPKAITLEQAKTLKPGQIVYSTYCRDTSNQPCRFKINGAVKTWKRDAGKIRVPYKYGLGKGRSGFCGYITEDNLHDFTLESNF